MSLSTMIKSMAATITCTDVNNRSAYSSCPSGYSVTSCSCGRSCGSWEIQSGVTCHCQCGGMDWTTARCCKITTKS
ncbi:hypothetical protein XELAEV_18008629mg [Xenopus laevis]|uniref:Resistin-like beta n=1 Tax=Xenopus laevis TaxID=8355 RepID=A0A974I6E4_XENLA|nr:hypothetical protein XELAEV_18008629mg [Xenopus laevis]